MSTLRSVARIFAGLMLASLVFVLAASAEDSERKKTDKKDSDGLRSLLTPSPGQDFTNVPANQDLQICLTSGSVIKYFYVSISKYTLDGTKPFPNVEVRKSKQEADPAKQAKAPKFHRSVYAKKRKAENKGQKFDMVYCITIPGSILSTPDTYYEVMIFGDDGESCVVDIHTAQ